jgi:YhcG PDDEXK nuclease domain
MGRQFKLEVSDKEYFIDLLFYHRKLKCLIAIELKTKKFEISHTQQLNLYLHILDKQIKYEDDNPSIGILICRDKDKILVEYALELATNPMGVASYTYNTLPEDIAKNLPSEAELKIIFGQNFDDNIID